MNWELLFEGVLDRLAGLRYFNGLSTQSSQFCTNSLDHYAKSTIKIPVFSIASVALTPPQITTLFKTDFGYNVKCTSITQASFKHALNTLFKSCAGRGELRDNLCLGNKLSCTQQDEQ